MLLHHVFSILGITAVLLRGNSGTEMMAAIFGAEITNPLLQVRWFLRTLGKHKTWYYEINDILFMSLFGIMRLGVGSNLLYTYLSNPKPDIPCKTCAVIFYMIGMLFWIMIVRYAYTKYQKKGELGKSPNNDAVSNGSEKHQGQLEQNGHIINSHNGNTLSDKEKAA